MMFNNDGRLNFPLSQRGNQESYFQQLESQNAQPRSMMEVEPHYPDTSEELSQEIKHCSDFSFNQPWGNNQNIF